MFKTFAFAATALTLAAGSAFAAPSDDARTHFQAIASGDTQIVMRAYADQAQLNWVGGPLDGTYATTDAIRGTWEKFGKAVGPLPKKPRPSLYRSVRYLVKKKLKELG
mgnify:CR=1 FL=1